MGRNDNSAPWDRDFRNPAVFHETILYFSGIFDSNSALNVISRLAERIRRGFQRIDPFVQEATQRICPRCAHVCCVSKHGVYTHEDLAYLCALGEAPAPFVPARRGTDPCHFLTATGCSLERWRRPSACNWYFCDPLLDFMEQQASFRDFDETFREVAELWIRMVEEFRKIGI